MMHAFSWHSSANDIVLVGAVLAALGVIWRVVLHPTVRFFKRLETTMTFVSLEMRPNGGGSLRDAIDKLVRRTESLEAVILPKEKP